MFKLLKWKNQVGDSGAFALGQGLELNNSLQFLELVRPFLVLCMRCVTDA